MAASEAEIDMRRLLLLLSLWPTCGAGIGARDTRNFTGLSYLAAAPAAQHNIKTLPVLGADNITGCRSATGVWVPSNLSGVVAHMHALTKLQPVGLRSIRAWDLYRNESNHPMDNIMDPAGARACGSNLNPDGFKHPGGEHSWSGLWWEAGVRETAALHRRFLGAYKAAGGELDLWVVDDEQGKIRQALAPLPAVSSHSAEKSLWRRRHDALVAHRQITGRCVLPNLRYHSNSHLTH